MTAQERNLLIQQMIDNSATLQLVEAEKAIFSFALSDFTDSSSFPELQNTIINNRLKEYEYQKLYNTINNELTKQNLPLLTPTEQQGIPDRMPTYIPPSASEKIPGAVVKYLIKPMGSQTNTAYLRKTPYRLMASQACFRGCLSKG